MSEGRRRDAGGRLAFASELKALALCPDLPRDIDGAAVADHVGFLWTAGESTMLRAVKKLRPGSMLTADRSGVRIARYWRSPLPQPGAAPPPGDPAALARLIDDIVAGQMVADVEVGALLSGGVDSSAIVASMCRATEPERITTFCAAVGRPASGADNFGDDSRYAHTVARDLGVRLIEAPTEADLAVRTESGLRPGADGAQVADPLGVAARRDQVAGAVKRQRVDRGGAPLARPAAPDGQDTRPVDADAHPGQPGDGGVEEAGGRLRLDVAVLRGCGVHGGSPSR